MNVIETTHKSIQWSTIEPGTKTKKSEEKAPTVTVSGKHGNIVFSSRCVRELGMSGKFIKFYYEPTKKLIAWKLTDRLQDQFLLKTWRLVRINKKSGGALVSILPIIKSFNLKEDSYKALEVKKNVVPPQDMLNSGDTHYYVEVK